MKKYTFIIFILFISFAPSEGFLSELEKAILKSLLQAFGIILDIIENLCNLPFLNCFILNGQTFYNMYV